MKICLALREFLQWNKGKHVVCWTWYLCISASWGEPLPRSAEEPIFPYCCSRVSICQNISMRWLASSSRIQSDVWLIFFLSLIHLGGVQEEETGNMLVNNMDIWHILDPSAALSGGKETSLSFAKVSSSRTAEQLWIYTCGGVRVRSCSITTSRIKVWSWLPVPMLWLWCNRFAKRQVRLKW